MPEKPNDMKYFILSESYVDSGLSIRPSQGIAIGIWRSLGWGNNV